MDNKYFSLEKGNDPDSKSYYVFKNSHKFKYDLNFYEGLDEGIKDFVFNNFDFSLEYVFNNFIKSGYNYTFKDCTFGDYDVKNINNSNFTFTVRTKVSGLGIRFVNCNEFNVLLGSKGVFNKFYFNNCVGFSIRILDDLALESNLDISFNECIVDDIIINNTYRYLLEFYSINSSFKTIKIKNTKFVSFSFNEYYNFSKLILINVFFDNTLSLVGFKENSIIELVNCNIKYVNINGIESSLSKLDLLRLENISYCNISNIEIKFLSLEGFDLKNVVFSNVKLSTILFKNFSVSNTFEFTSIVQESMFSLELKNSVLENVKMNPSFLHLFNKIFVSNSSITGINLFNFKYINDDIIKRGGSSIIDSVGFCRELVQLMNNQNNKYYATKYNALEHSFRKKDDNVSIVDKIVLTLNEKSNFHSTRPDKAFYWILRIIIIYYIVLFVDLYSYSGFDLSVFLNSWNWISFVKLFIPPLDLISDNLSVFFNPLKGISDVKFGDYVPHKFVKVFDFFYNVVYAYLVYQFVAAFRKFNKS